MVGSVCTLFIMEMRVTSRVKTVVADYEKSVNYLATQLILCEKISDSTTIVLSEQLSNLIWKLHSDPSSARSYADSIVNEAMRMMDSLRRENSL